MTNEELTWEKKDHTSIAQTAVNAASTIHQGMKTPPDEVLEVADKFYSWIVGKRAMQARLQGMPIEPAQKAPPFDESPITPRLSDEPLPPEPVSMRPQKVLGQSCPDCKIGKIVKNPRTGKLFCDRKCWLKE